jgi:hypothetical protein
MEMHSQMAGRRLYIYKQVGGQDLRNNPTRTRCTRSRDGAEKWRNGEMEY